MTATDFGHEDDGTSAPGRVIGLFVFVVVLGSMAWWHLMGDNGTADIGHPGDTPGGEGQTGEEGERKPAPPPCPDCGAEAGKPHRFPDPFHDVEKGAK